MMSGGQIAMSKFEKVSYKQFANAMFEYLGGDPDYSS